MKSLKIKIFINYMIVIAIALALIKIIAGGMVNKKINDYITNSVQNELKIDVYEIKSYLDSFKIYLNYAARQLHDRDAFIYTTENAKKWLLDHKLQSDVIVSYFIADAETGMGVLYSKGKFKNPNFAKVNGDYWQYIITNQNRDIFMTKMKIGGATGLPMLVMAKGVIREDKVVGLIGMSIKLSGKESLANKMARMGMNENSYGWMTDTNGTFVTQKKTGKFVMLKSEDVAKNTTFKNLDKLVKNAITSKSNMYDNLYSSEGVRYLSVYAPIPDSKLILGISIPYKVIYATYISIRNNGIIFGILVSIVLVLLILVFMPRKFKPLHAVVEALKNLDSNEADLTYRIEVPNTKDELAEVVKNFNIFIEQIHELVSGIIDESEIVAKSANAIETSTQNIFSSLGYVNDQIINTSTSVEEMSRTLDEISDNSTLALQLAKDANKETSLGVDSLMMVIKTIRDQAKTIGDASENIKNLQIEGEKIVEVMEIINSIAEQTNLLALNAAIEAARAGDAGRGFAVVADEVRNLAGRTHEKTEEIQQTIDALQEHIQTAAQAMQDSNAQAENSVVSAEFAKEIISGMDKSINDIESVNTQIASSTYQQKRTSDEISATFNRVMEFSNISKQGLEKLMQASSLLEKSSSSLKELMLKFKV